MAFLTYEKSWFSDYCGRNSCLKTFGSLTGDREKNKDAEPWTRNLRATTFTPWFQPTVIFNIKSRGTKPCLDAHLEIEGLSCWCAVTSSSKTPARTDGIIGSLKDCSVSLCSVTYGTRTNRKSISMSCSYKLPPPPWGAELCQSGCWKMGCADLGAENLAGLKWKSGYFTLMTHDEVSFGI